jgi:ribose 5-phosphate isomerase RpiB
MKVAVINETSAADKNAAILSALEGRDLEVVNAGMVKSGDQPELLYNHTALMSAILLQLNRVDFVIGGCGTGIGYLNAVMQYPGIVCGHILSPLDAFLFMRINAGNCISLQLNQGYGWAGEMNLKMIFDQLFSAEIAGGYPPQRKEAQKLGREAINSVSAVTHRPFAEIIANLPIDILGPAISYPGMAELIDVDSISDPDLQSAFQKRLLEIT